MSWNPITWLRARRRRRVLDAAAPPDAQLRGDDQPELYAVLQAYYRQNPAGR